jgi:hypothetical protein
MVTSSMKVRLFMHGGISVGVMVTVGTNVFVGMGVVVERICVGSGCVGGRNGVDVV